VEGRHTVVKRKQAVFGGGDNGGKINLVRFTVKKRRGRFVVSPNTGSPPFFLYK
jgi:hypothetical protein